MSLNKRSKCVLEAVIDSPGPKFCHENDCNGYIKKKKERKERGKKNHLKCKNVFKLNDFFVN